MLLPLLLAAAALAADPIDPPPVNFEALTNRLIDMVKPRAGERVLMLWDPTYYPEIANRLETELFRRGLFVARITELSPTGLQWLSELDDPKQQQQEDQAVRYLGPLFKQADIFYWMPLRRYTDDMRYERLLRDSKARGVHFHWILPFPGARTPEQVIADTKATERACLEIDFARLRAFQDKLANAMRGKDVMITTPDGTSLKIFVPRDQWFHFGDGDASPEKASRARSTRDREIELAPGIFAFLPDASKVEGVAAFPRTPAAAEGVKLEFRRGRVAKLEAAKNQAALEDRIRRCGNDGNLAGVVSFQTNPFRPAGVSLRIGNNWENGGKNRANGGTWLSFDRPTVRAGDRVIMQDGKFTIEY